MVTPSEQWNWQYCPQQDRLVLSVHGQVIFVSTIAATQLNCQIEQQPFSLEEAEAFWRFDEVLQSVLTDPQQRFTFCLHAIANRYRQLTAHKSWYFATQRQQDCGQYHLVQLQGKDLLTAMVVSSDLECIECLFLHNGETLAGKVLQAGTIIRVLRNRAQLVEHALTFAHSA